MFYLHKISVIIFEMVVEESLDPFHRTAWGGVPGELKEGREAGASELRLQQDLPVARGLGQVA